MMQLTNHDLSRYVGGQVEIKNPRSYRRGEAGKIWVENKQLRIYFTWLAEAVGYPIVTGKWKMADQRSYETMVVSYEAGVLVSGILDLIPPDHELDRILFHPPDSSGLHRSLIES